jgi:hypothetical protein
MLAQRCDQRIHDKVAACLGRTVASDRGAGVSTQAWFPALGRTKCNANSFFLPPDNMTAMTDAAAEDMKGNFVRNTCRA